MAAASIGATVATLGWHIVSAIAVCSVSTTLSRSTISCTEVSCDGSSPRAASRWGEPATGRRPLQLDCQLGYLWVAFSGTWNFWATTTVLPPRVPWTDISTPWSRGTFTLAKWVSTGVTVRHNDPCPGEPSAFSAYAGQREHLTVRDHPEVREGSRRAQGEVVDARARRVVARTPAALAGAPRIAVPKATALNPALRSQRRPTGVLISCSIVPCSSPF